MKKTFLFSIFIFSLLVVNCSLSQWIRKSNGIGINKTIWTLAAKDSYIFAGTTEGLFSSTNNGDYWEKKSNVNQAVNAIFVNANNIYLGTDSGVFVSTNNGQDWIWGELKNRSVWSFTANGSNIFAGTNGHGVYCSTNNGLNWQQTTLNNCFVSSLAVIGSNIFAGDWAVPYIYRSTNNGNNWTPTHLGGAFPRVVLSLAAKGSMLFAGADNDGVFVSSNYGDNWTQTQLNNFSVLSFSVKDNYLFAGVTSYNSGGVCLSTDNGNNWMPKSQGLGPHEIWSLLTANQYIFAGTDSSVWRRDFSEIIGIQKISSVIPDKYSLSQNYPNPFNPATKIKFSVPALSSQRDPGGDRFVTLKVYNILGKEVATLLNEKINPGIYEKTFDGSKLTSGIYFYSLYTDGKIVDTKKMVLLK